MKKRVVITGMGIASPLGSTVKDAFMRLKTYENCVQFWEKLTEYDRLNSALGAPVIGFEAPSHFTRKITRTMGRISVMAVKTAEDALIDSYLLGVEIVNTEGGS